MPQLNGGGGDDLGANDEMISFKDEGEQEEKISENLSAERDLADVKSSLVNESETNQNSSSDSEAERRPPPRSETFRDKTRESLEEGEFLLFCRLDLYTMAYERTEWVSSGISDV
ncbi:unnamed protein product [Coregonus sp. 'balchen']|nr:unnamed protein product [Coregonus sp. 'balchen']